VWGLLLRELQDARCSIPIRREGSKKEQTRLDTRWYMLKLRNGYMEYII
jgi:hypothetical protein